jgi:hypothetical protein
MMSVRPEVVLLWGSAGVGLLALLFPLLSRHNDPPGPLSWPRLLVAIGVAALLFGLSRLREYPFSPGGLLGDGLALGSAIAVVTLLLARLWPGTAVATVGAGGGALLGGSLVLLWQRGDPTTALAGFAVGHAVVTLLAAGEGDRDHSRDRAGLTDPAGLWAGPMVATLLAGAALLAIHRYEDLSPAERLGLAGKVWWVWPAAVLAAALAGQMVGLSLFARRLWAPVGTGAVTAFLLLLLWLRFPRYGPLMAPMAAGFVTALLIAGVQDGLSRAREQPPAHPPAVGSRVPDTRTPEPPNTLPALLSAAVVLLLMAAAYRLYTGYGIALAALGAAVLLPWLAEAEPRAVGRALFGLLTLAVLFRVYYQSYNLSSTDLPLTAHYSLVSLFAGAMAPLVFGSYPTSGGQRPARGGAAAIPGLLLPVGCLLLAAAVPLLLALFWGEKVGGGLLLGLVIGQGYRMVGVLLEADAPGRLTAVASRLPEAALLVMGWTAVQILDWPAAFGQQLLRAQRVGIIAALVAVCLIALLVLATRRANVRS